MAAAVATSHVGSRDAATLQPTQQAGSPGKRARDAVPFEAGAPVNFVYLHVHNAIRDELLVLEAGVKELLRQRQPEQLQEGLAALRERYTFLERVYKYHSSVEDEVVYPALDSKVKNVTLAYTVEHEDEERLFEQLAQLLNEALASSGAQQAQVVQQLACKVEEIHTTLRKHLAKEEEQLFPLLLRHFTHAEQARLVAQFLCTIPLASVATVLAWLKPSVPPAEQAQLCRQVGEVVEDQLLRQLLVGWLAPSGPAPTAQEAGTRDSSGVYPAADGGSPAAQQQQEEEDYPSVAAAYLQPAESPPAGIQSLGSGNVPLPVCAGGSSWEQTAVDQGSPRAAEEPQGRGMLLQERTSSDLAHNLQRQLPNLRTSSVPDVVLPPPRPLGSGAAGGVGAAPECCRVQLGGLACGAVSNCCQEPKPQYSPIEDILHLHAAIRSALESFADSARALLAAGPGGGSAKALETLVERHRFLRAVCVCHSASEEEVLLPAARRLCAASDPAGAALKELECEHHGEGAHFEELGRLLREVKSLARRNSREAAALTQRMCSVAEEMQTSMGRHMAEEEATMFPILQRHLCPAEQRAMVWRAVRAMPLRLLERVMPWLAAKLPEARVEGMVDTLRAAAAPAEAPLVQLLAMWAARGRGARSRRSPQPDDPKLYENSTCGPPRTPSGSDSEPPAKRLRTCLSGDNSRSLDGAGSGVSLEMRNSVNPIDHIFQFHKALRRDLLRLVADAAAFSAAAHAEPPAPAATHSRMIQRLEGRFQFMWGLYRAHSHSEDDIVFPALERKEALVNVSHAYTLDHQQEEQLLQQTHQVIVALKSAEGVQQLRQLALQLHRMSAALRASLEQHVQAEERELWPLFAENFTMEEQEALVGVIIGRTGAEVLASLLPWVSGSFTEEEHTGMMESLRSATRNTGFDRWLASTMGTTPPTAATTSPSATAPSPAAISPSALADATPAGSGCIASPATPARSSPAAAAAAAESEGPSAATGSGAGAAPASASLAAGPGGTDAHHQQQNMPTPASTSATTTGSLRPSASSDALAGSRADVPAALGTIRCTSAGPSGRGGGGGGSGVGTDAPLEEIAQYLAAAVPPAAIPGAAAPLPQSLAGTFRPGWEDIFRMNQKMLEGAVRRIGADQTLEPARKAYLMQHIMASRYIVAQQQGKAGAAASGAGSDASADRDAAGGKAAPPVHRTYTDDGKLGCKHYERGAALVAPCCGGRIYTCRHCHDEAEDHPLDVKAVTTMVCMHCGARGPVAGECGSCHKKLAAHFCAICRLWDDAPDRQIYHCPYCNLCRRGAGLGLDACHCMQCNCCMHLAEFATHKCRDLSTCPVCTEYLFDSSQPYRELPCGHFMHSHCFGQYTKYNYTCPLCSKSVGDMTVYFQMIDALVAAPGGLPPEYAERTQSLLCNDCGATSTAPFHFVYHKCAPCGSYNTRVLK